MNTLKAVVDLYRLLGMPEFNISNSLFSAEVNYNQEIYNSLKFLRSKNGWGEIDSLTIDSVNIDDDDEIPSEGDFIVISIQVSTGTTASFFADIDDFIQKTPMLNKGEFPDCFYLTCNDLYYDIDNNTKLDSTIISVLQNICQFIKSLSKMAHYSNDGSDDSFHKLVFLKNTNAQSLPLILETMIDTSMLLSSCKDIQLIEYLSSENDAITDIHFYEKKGIFINTLVDFLDGIAQKEQFIYLFIEWNDFLKDYHNNLGTYLSGFSFHKVRKEVADAESELAEKLSKIMTDIIAKLLSIPVSFVATFAMMKVQTLPEMAVIYTGVLFTSIFIFLVIVNQYKQLNVICDAKKIMFEPLETLNKSYPDDLKKLIDNASDTFNKNEISLKRHLVFFGILCWTPSVFGIYFLLIELT